MTVSLFDIVLLVVATGFVLFGIRFGFIHTVGSLVGVVAGAFVATHYGAPLAAWFARLTNFDIQQLGKWVVFLIIFFVVGRLVGFLFWLVDKSLNVLLRLPFLNSINHLLGGILGFFEGSFIIGLSLFYGKQLPVAQIVKLISESKLAEYFISISKVLLPLVPEAVKNAQKFF